MDTQQHTQNQWPPSTLALESGPTTKIFFSKKIGQTQTHTQTNTHTQNQWPPSTFALESGPKLNQNHYTYTRNKTPYSLLLPTWQG